jgi:hypothetical protein
MNWWLRNSLLGSVLRIFLGENWVEEKPKIASAVKIFLYAVLLMATLGLVMSLVNSI